MGLLRVTLPDGTVVEGPPEEVAKLLELQRAPAPLPRNGRVLLVHHDHDAPHAPPAPPVPRVPNNDALLDEYRRDGGIARQTRQAYVKSVEEFEHTIAPKSFTSATIGDVQRYERQLVDACSNMQTTFLGLGRASVATVPRRRCAEGLYEWSVTTPAMCATSCPSFRRQTSGPRKRLQGLRHFYDWLQVRGLVSTNVVVPVMKRHAQTRGGADEGAPKKYAPTLAEVRALLRACVEVKTPRDVALLLTLAKTGRRHGHVCELAAEDVRGLHEGPAYFRFNGVRERVLRKNVDGRTKLRGNLVAPIDTELAAYLRDVYLPWRQEKWGLAWTEGPLFPGMYGARKPFNPTLVQGLILNPLMHCLAETSTTTTEAEAWRTHALAGHEERISPGCFRHFFTTQLKEMGVPDGDIDILRGDQVRGSKRHYMHLRPEGVCSMYRMENLLTDARARGAPQRRLDV